MYKNLITKMTNHFSELGSIIYSKACDYSELYPITKDDIMMYYNLLNSEEASLPKNISKDNHIACCLFYLTKEDEKYKELFLEKFLRTVTFNNLSINDSNFIFIFNIIEFDCTFLKSPKDHLTFLKSLLNAFKNYPTNFENYIVYKYFKGFLKFRLKEYQDTNKEYCEIISETAEIRNPNFFIKYLKLKNSLLKVRLYNITKKSTYPEYLEYWQFMKDLFDEVKKDNKILAIKLGFDLFSSYLKGNNYKKCIPILYEMKKLLKKELLKGTTMKNGIDYYLGICSRLGYVGILQDDKEAIISAIRKIKKSLEIIKYDKNNTKLKDLVTAYTFVLAILEVGLTKRTEYNMITLANDFQRAFIPNIISGTPINYLVNDENKNDVIIDFKVINNMNGEINKSAKNILNNTHNEILKNQNSNSIFLTFIVAIHDKIYRYSQSYATDKNEKMRKFYKNKIKEYSDGAIIIVYKVLDNEPLLNTNYVKSIIIDIYSAYAHVFLYEKNYNQIQKIINSFDDLKRKINIDEKFPALALMNKVKGDYWLLNDKQKDYDASHKYYESALELFEKNNPKIAPVLFNNGCAYFFEKNKQKAKEYLNKCINEYNNVLLQKDIYGFTPDIDNINKNIYHAKMLLNQLS